MQEMTKMARQTGRNRFSAADTAEPEASIPEDRAPSGQGGENDSVLPDTGAPAVYMTTDMSAEGLMAVYEALDASPSGNIAVNLFVSFP